MANTIIAVETSNTFNQWRIVTNSLILAANELRNNTYIKEGGDIQIANGTIQVLNGVVQIDKPTGINLYVAANATIVGTLTVGNISAANFSSPEFTVTQNQANLAYTTANNAANTVRVMANSGSTQSAVSLNFINTASIRVSVGAGSAGNANVSFSAVAGTTAVAGILQLTDSVTSTSTTTAATPNSVRTANATAISAYSQANSGYTQANTANAIAVSAYDQANLAYTTANNAANTVRVMANSGSTQSAVSLNFINTASIRVSVGAGSAGNANVSFSAVAGTTAVSGIVQLTDSVTSTSTTTSAVPNSVKSAFDQATRAYAQANVATNRTQVSANGGAVQSNVGINFNNTSTVLVSVGPGTTGNANVSFRLPAVLDSLTVTSLSATSLTVTTPIIAPSESDSSSYRLRVSQTTRGDGTFGVNQGGANGNAEIKFTSSSGVWQLTSNSIAGAYYNIISSQNVSDSVTTTSSSNVASSTAAKSAFDQATAAFDRANTANSTANLAYTQANTANSIAISAYDQANLAYTQANTANSIAISAYGQANAAYTTANNAANTVRVMANSGSTQSAVSLNFINTASIRVSVGAGSAGNANIALTVIPTFTTEINTTSTLSITGGATLSSNLNVGGIANLGSIVSKTLDVAKIISNSTSIYNTTRISGIKPESLVYTGKYINISAYDSTPTGLDFKRDGTKLFLSGQSSKKISQFSLSVPWDSSTATFSSQSAALTTIDGQPRGIAFSSDGANVYVQGAAAGNVTQYSLSTAWDVASLTVASNVASYNLAADLVALVPSGLGQHVLRGLAFSYDGVFMYSVQVSSNGLFPKILQYTLSTAFNVATASLTSNSGTSTSGGGLVNSAGSYGWTAGELNFINGGTVLQVLNVTGDVVHFYALDTPWDITRTKFLGKTPSIIEAVPYGSFLSPDGKYLNIVGSTDDNVYTFFANSTTSLGISGDTIAYGDVDVYGSLMVNDITASGNVGIGNTAPNHTLSVGGNFFTNGLSTFSNSVTISMSNDLNALRITQTGTGNAFVVEDSTNPDSTPFVITASGNVGISNTSPEHTLSVSGNVWCSGQLILNNSTSTSGLLVANSISISGLSYMPGTIVAAPVLSVAASASYAGNAAGKTIVVDSASSVTLTFAASSLFSGFIIDIIRKGTGNVTIASTSSIAKLNVASAQPMSNISSRYATARVTYTATNEFILTGTIQP